MISVEAQSKHTAEQIVDRAVRFFGPEGVGLETVDQSECCVRFEGGGGFVTLTLESEEEEKRTRVSVQGREFDWQIRKFLQEV